MLDVQVVVAGSRRVGVEIRSREDPKAIASVFLKLPDGKITEVRRESFRGNGTAAWDWEARVNFYLDNDLVSGEYTAFVDIGSIHEKATLYHAVPVRKRSQDTVTDIGSGTLLNK